MCNWVVNKKVKHGRLMQIDTAQLFSYVFVSEDNQKRVLKNGRHYEAAQYCNSRLRNNNECCQVKNKQNARDC